MYSCTYVSITVNEARALRVSELTTEYQDIQRCIAHYGADPPESEYHEIGYATLRQCHTEARALLNANYPLELLHPPSGPGEAEKRQLQRSAIASQDTVVVEQCSIDSIRVIIDASARRFQAQKIYLQATAAMKWINQRNGILHGQKPQNGNLAQLHQTDNTLRAVFIFPPCSLLPRTGR